MVKNTSNLIPFCHNILIESIKINIEAKENSLSITCQVKPMEELVWKWKLLLGRVLRH